MRSKWTIGSYIALFFLVVPFVLTNTVNPEWLGRFIAVYFFFMLATIIAFWITFDTRIRLLRENAVLYRKWGKKKVDMISRGLLLLVGLFFFFEGFLPLSTDALFLYKNRGPLAAQGKIVETYQSPWGLGGIASQGLIIDTGREKISFDIDFHYPSLKKSDDLYEFFYVPKTKIILEIRKINPLIMGTVTIVF